MINLTPVVLATSSQQYTVEIIEKLCNQYCAGADLKPTVNVAFSVAETNLVGTVLYAKIQAQGNIVYVPQNGCMCNAKTQAFTESFTVSFTGATSSSGVTVSEASGYVEPAYVNCYNVAKGIAAYNSVTITMA